MSALPTEYEAVPYRRTRRVLVAGCWLYLATVIATVATLAFFADSGWAATLFLFGPRWVVALPLLLLVPPALGLRHRRAIVLLTVAALLVVFPIFRLVVNFGPLLESGERGALRIVTCNLGGKSVASPGWKRFWEQTQPDVLVLQESPHESLPASLPKGWSVVEGPSGLRVASRYPLREVNRLTEGQFGAPGGACLVRVEPAGAEFNLLAVHLPTPRPGIESVLGSQHRIDDLRAVIRERERASALSRSLLRGTADSAFVAGDFNMPPDSLIYREHWGDLSNAFSSAGLGWGHTKRLKWFGSRIDHVLFTAPWKCRACWIGPDIGSDHRPLIADFDLAD